MRVLVLALALLGACQLGAEDALDAPAADADLGEKSVQARLNEIERQGALLKRQLAAAEATIAGLEDEVAALTVKQKITENAQGEIRRDVGYAGQVASTCLDSLLALAGPPSDDGYILGYIEILEQSFPSDDYSKALHDALFDTDVATGLEFPRVDGGGLALAKRLRERPEALYAAWDDVIAEHLAEIQINPLFSDNKSPSNPIFTINQRLDGFVDDWQGEVAYLKVEDKLIWTESHDQRNRIGTLESSVGKLDERMKSVEGRQFETGGQVSTLGKRLDDVEAEAVTLWTALSTQEEALTGQLRRREGDMCVLSGLIRAHRAADDEAWTTLDADLSDRQTEYCDTSETP